MCKQRQFIFSSFGAIAGDAITMFAGFIATCAG